MFIYHRRTYHLVQLLLDSVALWLAWECAIRVRVLLNVVMPAHLSIQGATSWAPPLWLILILWALVSIRFKLYRGPDEIRFWNCAIWTIESALLVTVITVFVTFFSRQLGESVSRTFFSIMLLLTFVMLGLGRLVGLALAAAAQKRWLPPVRIALLGDLRNAGRLVARLGSQPARFLIRGLIVPEGRTISELHHSVPILGTTGQLAELINREQIDRVIVLNASLPDHELEACNEVLKRMGLAVSCAMDMGVDPVRMDISTQYGVPCVELIVPRFTRSQELVKRIVDIVFASLALLFFAPVMLAIAIVIKLTSKGPVLHKAMRVGKGGRHFMFLKLRSMYVTGDHSQLLTVNEKTGHIFKLRHDPRVTPVGRFLRRYSLDELPQLINVVAGEMSLVGPRPLPAHDLDPDGMSRQFYAWAEGRSRVHPGLTGLWQTSGRSDLSFEDMMRLDLEYISGWSLSLDFSIILETPLLVLKGAGAY
ncbi:MAG TPA: sugar transferase [Edaphobacter sp.]|nr:sugar transferase [Edaphobacter sp.]